MIADFDEQLRGQMESAQISRWDLSHPGSNGFAARCAALLVVLGQPDAEQVLRSPDCLGTERNGIRARSRGVSTRSRLFRAIRSRRTPLEKPLVHKSDKDATYPSVGAVRPCCEYDPLSMELRPYPAGHKSGLLKLISILRVVAVLILVPALSTSIPVEHHT